MTNKAEQRHQTWLSLGLAFVGGYADAASYTLVGTFTGHITGNSILAAVSIANRDWSLTISRLLAVGAFLLGIVLSSVVNRLVKRLSSRSPLTLSLFLEATLIFIAASLSRNFHDSPNRELFVICMCLALGLQNGAWRKADGISVHTTYVTGMVTKLLEHEFDPPNPPTDLTFRLLFTVWLSFLLGAGAGAFLELYFKSFTVTGVAFLVLLLAFCQLQLSTKGHRNR